MTDPTTLTAQDAAEALIAIGWPVTPAGNDFELWQIGDILLDDDELLSFAASKGIVVPGEPQ